MITVPEQDRHDEPPSEGATRSNRRVPVPYARMDEAGRVLKANRACLEVLGRDREAVLGSPFSSFLEEKSTWTFESYLESLLDEETRGAIEVTIRGPDDSTTPVEFTARTETGEGGNTLVHSQFEEIPHHPTDRQGAKIKALHDVAMELETVETKAGIFEAMIRAAEEVLDFDIATVAAREGDHLETKAISRGVTEEEYLESVHVEENTLGTHVYRNGESSLINDLGDRDVTDVDHGFGSALTVPISNYGVFQAVDREPVAFAPVDLELTELLAAHVRQALDRLENVTALKRQTASLRRERNRLEAIFEAVPEPIVHLRYEGAEPFILAVNTAFEDVFGYEEENIEGEVLNDLIVPADAREEANRLDMSARSQEVFEREVDRLAADGLRTFRLRSSVLEADGNPETLAIYVDLTDTIERERQLERENERLERFASIVSHDLRSPLTVARGRLELVQADHQDEHLREIEQSIDRMDAIIEDVLTLTRKGQQVTTEEREPVDLTELAKESWNTVEDSASTLQIAVDRTISADRSRLRRVFENLFWNAIEHAAEEDQGVTVTVGELPDGFYVADDGPGIPENDREKVFESGYTTSRSGTGLGLDIVRDIIEAHGWGVRLTENDGGGARFEIRVE